MRVICLGMNAESAVVLEELLAKNVNVVAIAGLPKEAADGVADYSDLAVLARRLEIPFVPVTNINHQGTLKSLEKYEGDVLFITGWSQLLKQQVIDVFPMGVVGSHPSALPFGRGRAPIPWTILQNLSESAVTLFQLTTGVDSGHILHQEAFNIPERCDATQLYQLVSKKLAEAFIKLHKNMLLGPVEGALQDSNHATWRAKRIPLDGWIDFNQPAERVDRLVRAVTSPYPGAYSYFGTQRVVFSSSEYAKGDDLNYIGAPGQILRSSNGMLLVQTGDVPLWLERPISIKMSQPFRVGDRFGVAIEDTLIALTQRITELERQIGKITQKDVTNDIF
ncbi:hypothetical protein F9L33_15585 [Amylibacter sp. SFDW26]|uniref:methionyl-tRNA formyltransferase n=1 Tax=Amylibacter sp. SFDW26 TaxID=2652722 RepID=UPI001262850F|nr:formyltransferase family protein [Amylibacter sp. SFDW26]KAB7609841.1 hypothetical protein F9L33_15585 [Amylibacter sp. SFDW26]